MRKWILRLHLYGGLLCTSYLLIFGISSLLYNHRPAFAEPGDQTITWERSVTPAKWANDSAEAKAVHDELGLIGWAYNEHRERNGDLRFTASRPGKTYLIRVSKAGNQAVVQETRTGPWQVVRGLHGLEALPNSRYMNIWGWLLATDLVSARRSPTGACLSRRARGGDRIDAELCRHAQCLPSPSWLQRRRAIHVLGRVI